MRVIELIYGMTKEDGEAIKLAYPNAEFTDASDFLHEDRYEVEIDGCDKLEFYQLAIRAGFLFQCLGFNLMNQNPHRTDEGTTILKSLVEYVKTRA